MRVRVEKKGTLSLKRMQELYKRVVAMSGCEKCGDKNVKYIYFIPGSGVVGKVCEDCDRKLRNGKQNKTNQN